MQFVEPTQVRMEGEAVEERAGQALVATEERRPLGERHRRRQDQAHLLVESGQHAKQQIRAKLAERHEADLVEDEQVQAQQGRLGAAEAVGGLGFQQFVDQPGRGQETHPVALPARGDS